MKIIKPQFERVDYDFSGKSIWETVKWIWKNPPRIKLTTPMLIDLENGITIIIPTGFVTDGASVPRIFWFVPGFNPFGMLFNGGIPHDFAYQYGYLLLTPYSGYVPSDTEEWLMATYGHLFKGLIPYCYDCTQERFDKIFLDVNNASGSRVAAPIAYKTLRMFGHTVWNKYRQQGPGVFNQNSLGLPGRNHNGVVF